MKPFILLLIVTLSVGAVPAAEVADKPFLQIRKVIPAVTADAEEMRVYGSSTGEVLHVEKAIVFDQTALKAARVQENSAYVRIAITFSQEGQERFARFTRDNIGTRLAIVIDGKLYCAPVIRDEIAGGNAEISGQFSEQEARELAAKINDAIKKH
jgi:preprotein translocase subunit SecD